MLLLSITMIFTFDLLHCDQEEDLFEKSDYLDYNITDLWWNSTPSINTTELMTPPYNFLPTPYGHGQLSFTDHGTPNEFTDPPKETVRPFPNISRPSFPFPIDDVTMTASRKFPRPLPLPPHGLPTIYLTTEDTYIPSHTGPTPKRPSFTLPSFTYSDLDPVPSKSTTVPPWVTSSTTPEPVFSPVVWDPVSLYAEMWKKKIASEIADHETSRVRSSTTPKTGFSFVSLDLAEALVEIWKEKMLSDAATQTPSEVVPVLRSVVNYN